MTDACGDKRGSYAGWNRHVKADEKPCAPCIRAQTEYLNNYRAAHPEYGTKNRKRALARSRALTRLMREYPAQFRKLYNEELRKEDLL